MSLCTIAFCLANLYVNVEVSEPTKFYLGNQAEGYVCPGRNQHWCNGPMGTLKIGMPVKIDDTMVIYYGVKHTSFIMEPHDRGQNQWFVSFTWMPFR